MKKENSIILVILLAAGLAVAAAYIFLKPDNNVSVTDDEVVEPTLSRQDIYEENQDLRDSNPDYADLTEEQIMIADKAIGHLLNSSEGITPPMITVKSFEEKKFSDGSLGCPQEGMVYTQAITPGHQVILEAQGKEYDYRIAGENTVILCEQ